MFSRSNKEVSLIIAIIFAIIAATQGLKLKHFQEGGKQTAQTFRGFSQVSVPKSQTNELQYFISFSRFSEGCDYKSCFYGWVNNFTIQKQNNFYGYPKSSEEVEAVFQFKANSKSDFVIKRHPKLSDTFSNIIEVGCELYQPNIRQDVQNPENQEQILKFVDLEQFLKQNPDSSISLNPPKIQGGFAGKIASSIKIPDVEAKISDLNEQILVDKQFNIIRRQKTVKLLLPSDSFGEQGQSPDFQADSNIKIDHAGVQPANHEELRKIVEGFKQYQGAAIFSSKDIQRRRLEVNYYKEDFKIDSKSVQSPDTYTINETVAKLISGKLVFATSPVCTITSTPSGEIPIWNYQKLLFQKTIFGKKFSLTFKLDAAIINNNKIRLRGYIVYQLFGNSKTVQAFSYIKQINLNWAKNYNINGNYGASIYIPLPPPVSFIGLNFAFNINFGVSVSLYAKAGLQIVSCVYTFQVGANVGTEVGVQASAAVRLIAIQGGVYIGGTLVNLSTDPKLVLAFNLQTKAVVPKITWYFYIKAFKFQWGFFYRYWTLFGGWSSKKIIAKWPISNGITQTYLVYKN